jgi:hypothetical protein
VFLVGAGGAGKSRVLKEAIQTYESAGRGVLVRFLSPTEEVTNKSLDDLGDRPKVLVVDDAHDRSDLQLLFQYASIPVLKAFGGPVGVAKDIARLTLDCPLATVMGAQVVAKEKIHFELAKNEEVFRTTLFGKFRDIIAGNIGNKHDAEPIRKLLRVLALLQPFHPEDPALSNVVAHIEELPLHEVNRLLRLLTDAGVLFKRGGQYRLSPDLLADFIIEDVCIGYDGRSTGYAEQVFNAASNMYIEHLLLNLGKLDWRRTNGDTSNSRL